MGIMGLRHTGNYGADERPLNWRAGISLLDVNGEMPLTGLTSRMKSKTTDDPEFKWWEKEQFAFRFAVTEDLDTSETAISIADGGLSLPAGTILRVEATGEVMRITSDPSSATLINVQRGAFGSTAATLTLATQNPYVQRIGTAFEQGSLAPTGVAFDPVQRYNYTQIFRNTFESTRTAMKTKLRSDADKKEARRECLLMHGYDMESAFLFGRRSVGMLSGKPLYTTGGIIPELIQLGNVKTVTGGILDMDEWESFLADVFEFGSDEKLALTGNQALIAIQQLVRKNTQYQIESGVKEFNMIVTRLVTPVGTLVLRTHKMFNRLKGGIAADTTTPYYGMNSSLLVLDMDKITYRNFPGDDTREEQNLEIPGTDGKKAGFLSECGLQLDHPKCHWLIQNLNEGAADS